MVSNRTRRNRRRRGGGKVPRALAAPPKARSRKASSRTVSLICSQSDPFCRHAVGAKMFDRDSSPSVPFQVRTYTTLSTLATDDKATIKIQPNLANLYDVATLYSGSTVSTWQGTTSADGYASLSTSFRNYRIVSFGARVFSVAPSLSASGTIICQVSDSMSENPDLTSSSFEEVYRFPARDCNFAWVSKPNEEFDRYRAVTNTSLHGTGIYISVDGGPTNTAVLGIEMVMNVELVPNAEDFTARLATPAAAHSPLIESAAATILGKLRSVAIGGVEAFGRGVVTAATAYASRVAAPLAILDVD